MPVGAKMVVVFKTCVEHRVLLALGHAFAFAFLEVSETDVFHCSSPLGASQQHSRCALDRSSYSRRARKKSTAEANCFYFNSSSRLARKRRSGFCRPGVSRFYSNLQDTRGLQNAAQVIQGFTNCGLGCGLKMTSP
jgi:hypothetical protein